MENPKNFEKSCTQIQNVNLYKLNGLRRLKDLIIK